MITIELKGRNTFQPKRKGK